MSRIGKKSIPVPAGVDIKLDGNVITVKGPKGELTRELHKDMMIELEGNVIEVKRPTDNRLHRSLHGLTRTLVSNMVIGVTSGFERSLDIIGTGYKASKQGDKLVLNVGYSHPVEIEPANGIQFETPAPTKVIIKGLDKEVVGQVAANVRSVRKPEPYHGKGIRYTGERIVLKAGKTGKAGK